MKSKPVHMQARQGFTLVEMMVTIAILAIISSMAMPSFSTLIAKQKLNQSTYRLVNTFKQARQQALMKHRAITVNLNNGAVDTATIYNW